MPACTAKEFFDRLMEMPVPDIFSDMPEEMAGRRFIADRRPQYIKSDITGDISLSMDLFEGKESVEEAIGKLCHIIKTMYPASVIYDFGDLPGMEAGRWFDVKSYKGEEVYYNIYFIAEKEDKKIFGSFQCPFEKYDNWKPQITQLLQEMK